MRIASMKCADIWDRIICIVSSLLSAMLAAVLLVSHKCGWRTILCRQRTFNSTNENSSRRKLRYVPAKCKAIQLIKKVYLIFMGMLKILQETASSAYSYLLVHIIFNILTLSLSCCLNCRFCWLEIHSYCADFASFNLFLIRFQHVNEGEWCRWVLGRYYAQFKDEIGQQ